MAAMRVLVISAVIAITACSPQTGGQSPGTASLTSTACSLPVWWGGKGSDVHAGFVSVPDGTVKDAGVLPYTNPTQAGTLGGGYGGAYDPVKGIWIRTARPAVSPDGSRYAYWTAGPSHGEIHVVDVATGVDHIAYSGTIPFILVGFESDAIYLAHIVNARQGAFELLYRLDPSGGSPLLVPGSDRHMNQWGWVLVADGAAWGIDDRPSGSDFIYSVVRLDLATAQVTEWIESPAPLWPEGIDGSHRLYAAVYGGQLWRVDDPGHAVQLPSDTGELFSEALGGPSSFAADPHGVWFGGQGAVWLHPDAQAPPRRFAVGPATEDIYPAGTCLGGSRS